MGKDTGEVCSNIRVEFELALTALRQYNAIHYSIAGVLIPVTTAGFTINNIANNQVYVFFVGVSSIIIWSLFYLITRFYVVPEVKQTFEYVQKLSSQLKELTDHSRQDYMELIEVFQQPRFTYVHLFNFLGLLICIGWIYYLLDKLTIPCWLSFYGC